MMSKCQICISGLAKKCCFFFNLIMKIEKLGQGNIIFVVFSYGLFHLYMVQVWSPYLKGFLLWLGQYFLNDDWPRDSKLVKFINFRRFHFLYHLSVFKVWSLSVRGFWSYGLENFFLNLTLIRKKSRSKI